jgi:hypothetical protein
MHAGQRLTVVSRLASVDQTWAEAFETAMAAELRRTGASAKLQSRSPLALQADKARYAAEIAAFNPDFVLVIEPGDGTVDTRGRSLMRRFEAGVFRHYSELDRRELSWRATVALEPAGMYLTAADMPALARDLVARLVADGILPVLPRAVVTRPVKPVAPSTSPQQQQARSVWEWLRTTGKSPKVGSKSTISADGGDTPGRMGNTPAPSQESTLR